MKWQLTTATILKFLQDAVDSPAVHALNAADFRAFVTCLVEVNNTLKTCRFSILHRHSGMLQTDAVSLKSM